jgi:DNA (cytosine-5)-methyltransferase 1
LRDLWEIGYDAEWHVIPAAAVGAFHLRERIWIVAYPNGFGLEADGGLLGMRLKGNATLRATPQDSLPIKVNGRSYLAIPERLRMDDGLSPGLDEISARIRLTGNAVHPLIPEIIGKCIKNKEVFHG